MRRGVWDIAGGTERGWVSRSGRRRRGVAKAGGAIVFLDLKELPIHCPATFENFVVGSVVNDVELSIQEELNPYQFGGRNCAIRSLGLVPHAKERLARLDSQLIKRSLWARKKLSNSLVGIF